MLAALAGEQAALPQGRRLIGINIVLNTSPSQPVLKSLGALGRVRDVIVPLKAVTMQVEEANVPLIRSLPFVVAANPDAKRNGVPVGAGAVTHFSEGVNTWNLDAINVTEPGTKVRALPYDGAGVYVAVIDTGLLDSWRQYFPEQRIAARYGIAFGGGGGEMGTVSSQPNKWEHDQDSHGTHVTSTILGYNFLGTAINGVAPMATVIPVKVLNQNGSGWSSVVARGIVYVADLKAGPLAGSPVVINMSLGGPELDAVEKAAIDYAVSKGVIVVASAGNEGNAGMGYPGAYPLVISVAACGWTGEWKSANWWRLADVGDPTNAADFYITGFSSRQKPGQDLDVAAPGSWVVGPYQVNSGQLSYYFLGGTSMASPHVAGIVALMAQKYPSLTAGQAESILTTTAIALPPDCRNINDGTGAIVTVCWGADAAGSGLVTADAALNATP